RTLDGERPRHARKGRLRGPASEKPLELRPDLGGLEIADNTDLGRGGAVKLAVEALERRDVRPLQRADLLVDRRRVAIVTGGIGIVVAVDRAQRDRARL